MTSTTGGVPPSNTTSSPAPTVAASTSTNTKDDLIPNIINALNAAKEAVKADNSADYQLAVGKYTEAISIMESELHRIPADNLETFNSKLNKYKKRITALEKHLPESTPEVHGIEQSNFLNIRKGTVAPSLATTRVNTAPPKLNIVWSEQKIDASTAKIPEVSPANMARRPYWLMRILYTTMTTGGFLVSPKLYINNIVWRQPDAKFTAVQQKVTALESLLESMCKLQHVDIKDTQQTSKQLEGLCNDMDAIQTLLSKHLSFIKQPKKAVEGQSILSKIGAKAERVLKTNIAGRSTDDAYVELLIEIFQRTDVVETWLIHAEEKSIGQLIELLHRVSDFFYNVLLAFVIRDFNELLMNYIRKMSQLFVKVEPGAF